jgi:anti-sigma-K factor RskA
MVISTDSRAPYQEESRAPPPRAMLDIASAFWTVVVAAVAAVALIWFLYATLVGPPAISVDTNARPTVETQPITPPAPVPATRPVPTP